MKRTLIIGLGALVFLAALFLPNAPANAASATCISTPPAGPVGTVFVITCSGFLPGEGAFAWVTEPDGATYSYGPAFAGSLADAKANGAGVVTYRFPTRNPANAASLGGYALTVKTPSAIGIARFNVGGGTEGVSGAALKTVGGTIVGSGFAPFEIVTVWLDYPNGDCSATWFAGPGLSGRFYANVKADAAGGFSLVVQLDTTFDCAGTYHFVARGNISHRGGETFWSTPNHPETESATLVADPDKVLSFRGFISFRGAGYAPSEAVTCWQTTPQGGPLPLATYKANGAGEISFGFQTGADYGFVTPSEGALGEWATTCRGNASGRIGIARYSVFGGLVDP